MDSPSIGRRKARRHAISVSGAYRTGSGTARAVELRDVSETGCRFIDATRRLYVGTQLTVRLGDLGPFDATVAWTDEAMVGLRFNQDLYEPLLEHLRAAFPYRTGELERRRIGR